MQRPDPESTQSMREAVKDMREALFVVADVANRLDITAGSTELHTFIQSANYNLGEAQRELAALSSDPVLLRAA